MADVSGKFFSAKKVRTGVSPSSPGVEQGETLPPVNPPGTSLNSVGLTMPSAFAVANSPLTSNGTIAVTGAGTVGQYVRGDGSLADFPESSGGGSSVSYYLNGSVNQGTIGGVAYKELNKVPILGAGTQFSIAADGYIASFLTDAGDPNLIEIPGGNWNFETYFSASSGGGSPTFYVELYKYNGTTFTLIASSVTSPELIAFGTNLTPYFSTLAVPTTVLALTDRLAIRYYVTHSGRTITMHTENNTLCQIITTFTTGITALNGLTAQVQNFAVGTTGTDFNIASATATHTFNLPTASATNRGALSSADWNTFNNKQNALTNPVTGTGAAGQVAFWSSGSAITGESDFTYNSSTNLLTIGGGITLTGAQTIQTSTGNLTIATAAGNGNILITPNGTGGVGINTVSPTATLDIRVQGTGGSASTASNSIIISPATITDITEGEIGSQIILNARRNGVSDGVSIASVMSTANFDLASMAFYTHANSVGTPRVESMRIFGGTGNLLLQNGGTFTDTGFRLDVNGTARVQGNLTTNLTAGSVPFIGASGLLSQDNTNLFWDNTNKRLGVGTNSAASTLNVRGNIANTVVISGVTIQTLSNFQPSNLTGNLTFGFNTTTADAYIFSGYDGASIIFSTRIAPNNFERWRITSTGILQSNGAQIIQTSTGNLTLATAGGNGNILLIPNGTGNVGIGAAIPTQRLQVFEGGLTALKTYSTTNAGAILVGYQSEFSPFTKTTDLVAGSDGTTPSQIRFITRTAGQANLDERMRIFSDGNVFIGSSPSNATFKLDVNGTARVQGVLTTTADAVVNGINVGKGGGNISTNTRVGTSALNANTTGSANSSFGINAGLNNTTGSANSFFGVSSGASNITTSNNSFFGRSSGQSNTDSNNTFVGFESGSTKTTGANNSFFGTLSGRHLADGATALTISNNSIFIGYDTRSAADNQTNQIVIGHTAIGLGSNTTVLGNTSTTHGRWYGSLLLGTTTNAASSILTMESTTQGFLPPRMTTTQRNAIASPATGLVVYDTTLNDPFYYNGTAWTMFQDGITLTTTGTSGAATLVGTTLNIPQYQAALTNPVTGTGATNTLAKFTSNGSTIGNSGITEDGTTIIYGSGSGLKQIYINGGGYDLVLGASGGGVFGFTSTNISLVFSTTSKPLGIGTNAAQPLIFGTSAAEQMRLDPSGNLGLGVTPSAWNSAYKAFQFGTTGALFGENGDAANYFTTNTFVDSVGFKYITSDWALGYFQENGVHSWRTAPSGTAGNAISFTQAMTLGTNSGLSIGTPSAAPSQGLLVQGNVGIGGSPSFKLDVNSLGYGIQHYGNGSNYLRTYAGSSYQVIESNGTNQFGYFNGNFFVQTSATDRLTIASTGAATFSSSVTAAFLRITDSAGEIGEINSTNANGGYITWRTSGTTIADLGTAQQIFGTGGNDTFGINGRGARAIAFGTNNTERMRITSGGNVGIGTNNPAQKFSVEGEIAKYCGVGGVDGSFENLIKYGFAADLQSGTSQANRWIGIDATVTAGSAVVNTLRIRAYSGGTGNAAPVNVADFRGDQSSTFYGNVLIGTQTDNGSRLRVNGSLAITHTTKSANYTLDNTDYTVGFDCASNRTATLPDATTCAGRIYVIYQYNTGTAGARYVTIDPNGSQTINGLTTFSLQYHYDFSSVMIQSNGSNWIIISDALYPAPV